MTDAELDEIEARAAKATQGPWAVRKGYHRDTGLSVEFVCSRVLGVDLYSDEGSSACDDAFVTAARTDVPALVAEVRRLRAAMTKASRELKDEAPGCRECIGEYGTSGTQIAWALDEALGTR